MIYYWKAVLGVKFYCNSLKFITVTQILDKNKTLSKISKIYYLKLSKPKISIRIDQDLYFYYIEFNKGDSIFEL